LAGFPWTVAQAERLIDPHKADWASRQETSLTSLSPGVHLANNVPCATICGEERSAGEKMGKKVLIVDTALYNRIMLRAILEGHGYSVVEASTGEKALKMYRRARPDLVALEVATADARDFRNLDPSAMILMCGGHGQRRLVTQGLTDGADGVIFKPYSERQVVRVVRRAIG